MERYERGTSIKRMKETRFATFLVTMIVLLACGTVWGNESGRYADLGDFKLDSGETLRNCRVAYLTHGTLNAEKSNVVLVPTWLAGTSKELSDIGFIGPGKIFDTEKYYVIAVDSFGNGVSLSPSNSKAQSGRSFPHFTIRDMVRAQYILLTKHLNIKHIRAVAGISMCAMETYQWMVSYPAFMDMAIPILGEPWMTSYGMLLWSAQLAILENIQECKGSTAAMKALTPLFIILAWPPDYHVAKTKPSMFPAYLAEQQERMSKYDALNWASQIWAILHHDILKEFGGQPEKAAAAIRAKCLVIASAQDQIIYPKEAKVFARLIGAETAELNGECGHFAFLCDQEKLRTTVNAFLAQNPGAPARPIPVSP
jgi:homoserine O-acetyltransferase/O-succinyltransferase